MKTLVNGHLSFEYDSAAGSPDEGRFSAGVSAAGSPDEGRFSAGVSGAGGPDAGHASASSSVAAVEQKSCSVAAAIPNAGGIPDEITQAGSGTPLTVHIQGDCYGEAVLFIKESNGAAQDLQPFRIQTSARRCIIVTDDAHRNSLYHAIFKQIETVTFMSPGVWSAYKKRNELVTRIALKVCLVLGKCSYQFRNVASNVTLRVANFLAPKITPVCLDKCDRDTNEICYSSNVNGVRQEYRIAFPVGGALDLRKVQDPNDPSNCLLVTSIGREAFYYSWRLTSIEIPEGLISIGRCAFQGCCFLKSAVIPDSVTSIGEEAFNSCISLKNIEIPDGVTSIAERAFWGCSSLTSIVIPDSVTSIGIYAFGGCSSLTSIEIPGSVTSIGIYAFEGCSSLTSVVIPAGVTSIAERAFWGCSSLTSIVIPAGVTSISEFAFYGCSSLKSIVIPAGVTSISECAFYGCSSLTSIVIPDSVTRIRLGAFQDCSSLTSIEIPASVTSIGDFAFGGCSSLTSIVIRGSVTSMSDGAFEGCINLRIIICSKNFYPKSGLRFWDIFRNTSSDITIVGDDGSLLRAVNRSDFVFPAGVTSIGQKAFSRCSSLTSIVIPDSVTSMSDGAFEDCINLRSIRCTRDFYDNNKSSLRIIFGSNISKITFLDPEGGLIKGPYTAGVSASTSAAVLLSVAAVAIGCCMIPFGAITALIIATAVVGGLAVSSVGVASGLGILRQSTIQKAKSLQASVADTNI